jgi:nucleoside-diphosphate-sugar epimerase
MRATLSGWLRERNADPAQKSLATASPLGFDASVSRAFVTGQRGLVGAYVVDELRRQGHSVVGFDLVDGHDVLDGAAVSESMTGCEIAIHLAAADTPLPAEQIVETNVVGAKNVLDAAVSLGLRRVVLLSSVDALGIFMGEAPPAYLPIDDAHPARPTTPYGASKRVAERMAERTGTTTGTSVICLRPPGVCDDAIMAELRAHRAERPSYEWDPIWEYSAWIHADDLARAVVAACFCPPPIDGYACVLVAASAVNSDEHSGRELAGRVHPTVPWRGGPEYDSDPTRSLIETAPAQELLGWEPRVPWAHDGSSGLDAQSVGGSV